MPNITLPVCWDYISYKFSQTTPTPPPPPPPKKKKKKKKKKKECNQIIQNDIVAIIQF